MTCPDGPEDEWPARVVPADEWLARVVPADGQDLRQSICSAGDVSHQAGRDTSGHRYGLVKKSDKLYIVYKNIENKKVKKSACKPVFPVLRYISPLKKSGTTTKNSSDSDCGTEKKNKKVVDKLIKL